MNSKISEYIISTAKSGEISQSEAAQLVAIGTTSVHDISSFPESVQMIFREAFRSGTRWCFISLIPWCGVAFIATLFLKEIVDTDNSSQPAAPVNEEPENIALDPVEKPTGTVVKQDSSDVLIESGGGNAAETRSPTHGEGH
jgi:hypothetical protein